MVPDRSELPATMGRWRAALAAHAVQPELSLLRPVSAASLEETCCASTLGGSGRILVFCKPLSAFPATVHSLTGIIKHTLLSAQLSGGTLKEGP